MRVGDTVMYNGPSISLKVKILDVFSCEDGLYAEVTPTEFSSISREVPVSCLEEIA